MESRERVAELDQVVDRGEAEAILLGEERGSRCRQNRASGTFAARGSSSPQLAPAVGFVLRIVCTCWRPRAGRSAMEPFDVFSARELRQRAGELFRDAEQGRLSVITKHGRPAILAIPFDDRLLSLGVQRAVAVGLFETGSLSLAQGAKLAGLSMEEFMELLGREGVVAVDYSPEELAADLEAAL